MPVVIVDTDAAEKLETRRRKMREAQRRYYDKHRRKKPERPEPRPLPYCPEHIRACKREYYLQHRDAIIARSKQRYQDDKALRKTAACGPTQEA
jgi:hypothetical protein